MIELRIQEDMGTPYEISHNENKKKIYVIYDRNGTRALSGKDIKSIQDYVLDINNRFIPTLYAMVVGSC